jgi:asparagine synthase (glutamine-hydrolysing)
MTDAMTHRGPDDRGFHTGAGIALGVRRLSIVDVTGGHQPFSSEDGRIVAIQNGELYNHGDLRGSLGASGHTLTTHCDTEVLPHLYEMFGTRYPESLRGMFATAVWDEPRRRIVLARDRLGVKPLYWSVQGDLLGFFPAPLTPVAGVHKLLPGHTLVGGAGGVRVEPFWEYPIPLARAAGAPEEHAAALLDRLEESVRLRLMSDVPLGAMLSGGLDSSLVVGLMARNMSEPVKTFAVGFAEAADANELADARLVAETFGTDHHELELSYADAEIDFAELVWSLDEPLADLSSLGFLALSELASTHVTVALSGQGADELLGGYPRHRNAERVAMWLRLPRAPRLAGATLLGHGPEPVRRAGAILAADDPAARFHEQQRSMDDARRMRLYRGALAETSAGAARGAINAAFDGVRLSPLEAALRADAKLGLPDDMLHYFDRASMTHSLEVRVPFLDHRLVEHCAGIPSGLKVRRGVTKYVLKLAARGLVPDAIIDKPKAVSGWLRSQLNGQVSERLLGEDGATAEILDRSQVAALMASIAGGRAGPRESRLLLSILMLEIWLSSYLPRARRVVERAGIA